MLGALSLAVPGTAFAAGGTTPAAVRLAAMSPSGPVTFDVAYGTFENEGSLPLEMNRLRGRLKLNLKDGAGVAAEYAYDEYDESTENIADYTAARYGLFLTWSQ